MISRLPLERYTEVSSKEESGQSPAGKGRRAAQSGPSSGGVTAGVGVGAQGALQGFPAGDRQGRTLDLQIHLGSLRRKADWERQEGAWSDNERSKCPRPDQTSSSRGRKLAHKGPDGYGTQQPTAREGEDLSGRLLGP